MNNINKRLKELEKELWPEENTYDIYGYKTKKDFDNLNFVVLDEIQLNMKDAIKIGKGFLNEYEIVKVQSNDREEIEILNKL